MMQSQSSSISSRQSRLHTWRRVLLVLAAIGVTMCVSNRAKADLDTRNMFSIEWLVDESDTIVIVRDPPNPEEGNPKVLRCMKGNAASIVWPLTPMKTPWPSYKSCVPPYNGPVRLLFIRGSSQLLQAVSLGRERAYLALDWKDYTLLYAPEPSFGILPTLYGVNQFGDLLLTESSLYHAIDARLKMVPAPVKLGTNPHGVCELRSADLGMVAGVKFACSSVPKEFPLAFTDEYYSIVVPFDTHRRDYYLEQLKSGFVFEKIFAVYQLAGMMDAKAHAAVRVAVQCDDVELGYYESGVYHESGVKQEFGPWNSVHFAALAAIENIDKHRDSLISRLASPVATDKIDAINELAIIKDPKAVDAIRRATQAATAIPFINTDKGTSVDVQTVRETATKALEQIERERLNETKPD